VKVEALGLLQAEANKLRVEKEFLEKQLVSKDSRIAELEGEVQELTGEMAGAFDEGFQEALAQASCENPGINVSNCDPTHHVVDGKVVMEIKLKRTWRPINKIKTRWRHKWRTPMEVKVHLKALQEACSKLWELEDIYFLFL